MRVFREICSSILYNGLFNELVTNRKLKKQNLIKSAGVSREQDLDINKQKEKPTSISDSDLYPGYASFCSSASTDMSIFQTFRSSFIYKDVLEHVPHRVGIKYATSLRKSKNFNLLIQSSKLIDNFGNPWRFNYKNIGLCSPTTLRYLFFADKITVLFPNRSFSRVCEIGCGFGGQILALSSVIKFNHVTFVDLQPVLTLTQKFATECNVTYSIELKSPQSSRQEQHDLLISNYAFSELTREFQDKYLDLYVKGSKHGFMMWNPLSYEKFDGYSLEQILEKIPNSHTEKEIPTTFPDNYLIYW